MKQSFKYELGLIESFDYNSQEDFNHLTTLVKETKYKSTIEIAFEHVFKFNNIKTDEKIRFLYAFIHKDHKSYPHNWPQLLYNMLLNETAEGRHLYVKNAVNIIRTHFNNKDLLDYFSDFEEHANAWAKGNILSPSTIGSLLLRIFDFSFSTSFVTIIYTITALSFVASLFISFEASYVYFILVLIAIILTSIVLSISHFYTYTYMKSEEKMARLGLVRKCRYLDFNSTGFDMGVPLIKINYTFSNKLQGKVVLLSVLIYIISHLPHPQEQKSDIMSHSPTEMS